jgi:hypothetical protein
MGGFLEYLALNWDHVVELAIGHAIGATRTSWIPGGRSWRKRRSTRRP